MLVNQYLVNKQYLFTCKHVFQSSGQNRQDFGNSLQFWREPTPLSGGEEETFL